MPNLEGGHVISPASRQRMRRNVVSLRQGDQAPFPSMRFQLRGFPGFTVLPSNVSYWNVTFVKLRAKLSVGLSPPLDTLYEDTIAPSSLILTNTLGCLSVIWS